MSIYSRRGDTGTTGLGDGSRTTKASPRIEAIGSIDELAAAIAFARAASPPEPLGEVLTFVQHRLANCAALLAFPEPRNEDGGPALTKADIEWAENTIDTLTETTGEFRQFVIASDGEAAARLNLARTAARRAERRAVALDGAEEVSPLVLAFLNRLSDLLYAAASFADAKEYRPVEVWDPKAEPPRIQE